MTPRLTSGLLAMHPLPPLEAGGDKDSRGCVLVVAGGGGVPGAPLLTGHAALRVGAGKLQLAATPGAAVGLGLAVPEALILPAPETTKGEFAPGTAAALRQAATRAAAACSGPGMMDSDTASRTALDLLELCPTLPCVIDAGALPGRDAAARFSAAARGRVVLTPHAGEMASMLERDKDDVRAKPLQAALEAAALWDSVIVLKGATTYVVGPDGSAFRHDEGVVGLGTSGSGDVLAGAIAGLLARGASPSTAALWGVYLHAAAGAELSRTVGTLGFLASELLPVLPRVLQEVAA